MREAVSWSRKVPPTSMSFMPVREACVPVTDWAYRRSDVTYDVVGVWGGAFFRLDDHLRRFQASMSALRMRPSEDEANLRAILHELVRCTGLREAYVTRLPSCGPASGSTSAPGVRPKLSSLFRGPLGLGYSARGARTRGTSHYRAYAAHFAGQR